VRDDQTEIDKFLRASIPGRDLHGKLFVMIFGKNAECQPDLFQVVDALDPWGRDPAVPQRGHQ
jgi:hypothetical protein